MIFSQILFSLIPETNIVEYSVRSHETESVQFYLPSHFSLLSLGLQKLDVQIVRSAPWRAYTIHRSDISIFHKVFIGLLQFDRAASYASTNRSVKKNRFRTSWFCVNNTIDKNHTFSDLFAAVLYCSLFPAVSAIPYPELVSLRNRLTSIFDCLSHWNTT